MKNIFFPLFIRKGKLINRKSSAMCTFEYVYSQYAHLIIVFKLQTNFQNKNPICNITASLCIPDKHI